jgi:hypothetical protein
MPISTWSCESVVKGRAPGALRDHPLPTCLEAVALDDDVGD